MASLKSADHDKDVSQQRLNAKAACMMRKICQSETITQHGNSTYDEKKCYQVVEPT